MDGQSAISPFLGGKEKGKKGGRERQRKGGDVPKVDEWARERMRERERERERGTRKEAVSGRSVGLMCDQKRERERMRENERE